MAQTRDHQVPNPQEEQVPLSAEDANRLAAVERASHWGRMQWAEDRRRRPGTRANRGEGHADS